MPNRRQNLNHAVAFALLTSLVASIAAATTKYLTVYLNVGLIVFIQYSICLITLLPWVLKTGKPALATKHPYLHLIRGLAGWFCFYTYYLAIREIPLVDASLLRNTAPICVPFFMFLFFRVKLEAVRAAGIAIGFAGVMMILQPKGENLSTWHAVGFLSGLTLALSMIFTRELTAYEPSNRILFYYFFISSLCSLPLAIMDYTPIPMHTVPALIFVGLSIFLTMKLYNLAYSNGPANLLAPFTYFGVVFAGLFGWLFWGHAPDSKAITGIALVMVGGCVTLMLKKRAPDH